MQKQTETTEYKCLLCSTGHCASHIGESRWCYLDALKTIEVCSHLSELWHGSTSVFLDASKHQMGKFKGECSRRQWGKSPSWRHEPGSASQTSHHQWVSNQLCFLGEQATIAWHASQAASEPWSLTQVGFLNLYIALHCYPLIGQFAKPLRLHSSLFLIKNFYLDYRAVCCTF